jgi:hypothetical protein
MRLRFAELPEGERPRSSGARFSERWQEADDETEDELNRVVNGLRARRTA